MYQAGNTPLTLDTGKMFCPCRKCKNSSSRFARSENVWKHLLNRGFTPNYYIWFHHGEGYGGNEASSSNSNVEAVGRDDGDDRSTHRKTFFTI